MFNFYVGGKSIYWCTIAVICLKKNVKLCILKEKRNDCYLVCVCFNILKETAIPSGSRLYGVYTYMYI